MFEQLRFGLFWVRRALGTEMFLGVVQRVLHQRRVRIGERQAQRLEVVVDRMR